jgi:deoxyhypusine synthase
LRRSREILSGEPINREPISPDINITELVDRYFQAYNAGRLREACQLFVRKMLRDNVTVGMSLTGALTPAGLGGSCIVPLIKAGFVDWIVSTGANLYHDIHFSIGYKLHRGTPFIDDRILRRNGVIRIYDILFDYKVLLSTDGFIREVIKGEEFQREMGTAEFHYLLGKYVYEREKILGIKNMSILSACYRYGVPVYTSSPGDSSIGMNIAALSLNGSGLKIDISRDVNETASIVYSAKQGNGRSAVLIFGGGSPKNFLLQTEPQIQEILGIDEKGHDYFLQITDARPDTGGLSGATPSEAVSWGKIDPDRLPDAVVCYADVSIAMPILVSYALAKRKARRHKRLYHRRDEMMNRLKRAHKRAIKKKGISL